MIFNSISLTRSEQTVYTNDMCANSASPLKDTDDEREPIWLRKIGEWLRTNASELSRHEHVQLIFNRAGDQVQADYSIKSIKIK